jgi:hypothetical protein
MGFVNRISAGRDQIDGYICGSCISTWELRDIYKDGKQIFCPAKDDFENYFDPDIDDNRYNTEFCDEAEEIHIKQWHPEVDASFPDAPRFRDLMQDEGQWTDAQIKEVQALIDNYKIRHKNQITITSSLPNDIKEIQVLIEAWRKGDVGIARGDDDFETWEAKGVEIMYGCRGDVSTDATLEKTN